MQHNPNHCSPLSLPSQLSNNNFQTPHYSVRRLLMTVVTIAAPSGVIPLAPLMHCHHDCAAEWSEKIGYKAVKRGLKWWGLDVHWSEGIIYLRVWYHLSVLKRSEGGTGMWERSGRPLESFRSAMRDAASWLMPLRGDLALLWWHYTACTLIYCPCVSVSRYLCVPWFMWMRGRKLWAIKWPRQRRPSQRVSFRSSDWGSGECTSIHSQGLNSYKLTVTLLIHDW